MSDELVRVTDIFFAIETEKAYGFSLEPNASAEVWIPKSQVDDKELYYDGSTPSSVVIPEWLAEDKELIYDYFDDDGL